MRGYNTVIFSGSWKTLCKPDARFELRLRDGIPIDPFFIDEVTGFAPIVLGKSDHKEYLHINDGGRHEYQPIWRSGVKWKFRDRTGVSNVLNASIYDDHSHRLYIYDENDDLLWDGQIIPSGSRCADHCGGCARKPIVTIRAECDMYFLDRVTLPQDFGSLETTNRRTYIEHVARVFSIISHEDIVTLETITSWTHPDVSGSWLDQVEVHSAAEYKEDMSVFDWFEVLLRRKRLSIKKAPGRYVLSQEHWQRFASTAYTQTMNLTSVTVGEPVLKALSSPESIDLCKPPVIGIASERECIPSKPSNCASVTTCIQLTESANLITNGDFDGGVQGNGDPNDWTMTTPNNKWALEASSYGSGNAMRWDLLQMGLTTFPVDYGDNTTDLSSIIKEGNKFKIAMSWKIHRSEGKLSIVQQFQLGLGTLYADADDNWIADSNTAFQGDYSQRSQWSHLFSLETGEIQAESDLTLDLRMFNPQVQLAAEPDEVDPPDQIMIDDIEIRVRPTDGFLTCTTRGCVQNQQANATSSIIFRTGSSPNDPDVVGGEEINYLGAVTVLGLALADSWAINGTSGSLDETWIRSSLSMTYLSFVLRFINLKLPTRFNKIDDRMQFTNAANQSEIRYQKRLIGNGRQLLEIADLPFGSLPAIDFTSTGIPVKK